MPGNRLRLAKAATFLLSILLTTGVALAGVAGNIVRLQGDATITSSGGAPRIAKGEDVINEGDLISTEKGAEAVIRFNDQSTVSLRQESSLLIAQFRHDNTTSDTFAASLFKGALRSVSGLIGKAHPQKVKFTTNNATIGIRGTDFEIAIRTEDTPDARAGTYNYVHSGITAIGLANAADEAGAIDVKQEETGLALANPRPGEPALQILKQRPAFLRGGGFDAHMMQLSIQPMRTMPIRPNR